MMRVKRTLCILAAAAMLLGLVYTLGAQPQSPYPIGEITLQSTQVAAGVGVTWGDGILKFQGKQYKFQARGLDAGAVGISKISAKGDVYNMKSAADFPGHYVAAQAGVAVIKGEIGLLMRNEKGTVINLKATQKGVQLSLGGQGMNITMK